MGILIILLTFATIASGIFANKMLLASMSPTMLVGIRMFTAGLLLLAFNLKDFRKNFSLVKSDILRIMTIAMFITLFPSILKAYGLKNLHVSHSALLGSIDPFITAFYAYILWNERLGILQVLGISLGLFATAILPNLGNLNINICAATILPQLAAVFACFLNRGGWIMARGLLKKEKYKISQLNSLTMITSGVIALIAVPIMEANNGIPQITYSLSFWLVFTILIGNIVGYNLFGYILKNYNLTLISLTGCSVPLFVGILNWVIMGQTINSSLILSIVLLFTALFMFNFKKIDFPNILEKIQKILATKVLR